MTADEFVKIVRGGSEKLRVDNVVINTGTKAIHGKGMLQISRESIKITVTLEKRDVGGANELPEVASGVFTKRDYWKMTGLIEDDLQFNCDYVGPIFNRQHSWPSGISKCTIDLHPINLIPSGWEAIPRAERQEILRQHQANLPEGQWQANQPVSLEQSQDDFCFYATLFDFPLINSSWEPEIKGATNIFDFTLKKIDDTSDIFISLCSKKEHGSQGEERDWKQFNAFMFALAYITGVSAWPYRIKYVREGRTVIDRVTAAYPLPKTSHAAFSDRLAFHAKTGSLKWNFQETIKTVATFFEAGSPLADEVSYLHFLFRQAGEKAVHGDITVITLCVLFENLVRQIFEHLKLADKARSMNPVFNQFEQAREHFLKQLDEMFPNKDDGQKRLYQMVKSAHPFNVKSMLITISNHFGLKWEGDMELIFDTWQQFRNPVVHRGEYANRSENEIKQATLAESQIAGGINILSLKLFGYSGYMQNSAFEQSYRQI